MKTYLFSSVPRSYRTCHLLGVTTGGEIMVMIPGLQTGRNSNDECQMSDLFRKGSPKIPQRTPGWRQPLVIDGLADEL